VFRKLSVSTNRNNLLPKEFTGREDSMILNATFLVFKTKVNDFRNAIDTLSKKNWSSGCSIEISGPCPPYSFIYIKENL